ncbi:hypothetical protein D3C76_1237470 [compost metagenome]
MVVRRPAGKIIGSIDRRSACHAAQLSDGQLYGRRPQAQVIDQVGRQRRHHETGARCHRDHANVVGGQPGILNGLARRDGRHAAGFALINDAAVGEAGMHRQFIDRQDQVPFVDLRVLNHSFGKCHSWMIIVQLL